MFGTILVANITTIVIININKLLFINNLLKTTTFNNQKFNFANYYMYKIFLNSKNKVIFIIINKILITKLGNNKIPSRGILHLYFYVKHFKNVNLLNDILNLKYILSIFNDQNLKSITP